MTELTDQQDFDDEEDEETSPYLWCLHCERAFPRTEHRQVHAFGDTHNMCPYEDCDGSIEMDAWNWDNVRQGREKEYPEIPEKGVRYPLYN